jgi:hypothetical protein
MTERRVIRTEHDPGIPHVCKLDGKSQSVGIAAPLMDEGEIGLTERVLTYKFIRCTRNGKKAPAFGGRED